MRSICTLGLCGLVASMVCTLAVSAQNGKPEGQINQVNRVAEEATANVTPGVAQLRFRAENPGSDFMQVGGRITRVYGQAFSHGESPHEAAERFRLSHSGIWGVPSQDLVARGPFEDGRHLQPIMYENGRYKFTGVYYTHQRSGIDVFRSHMMLLARNDANYPVVLASANLRDIGNFLVDQIAAGNANAAAGVTEARKSMPADAVFGQANPVIFAGVDGQPHPPVLAVAFEGEGGDPTLGTYAKRLFVADAATGQILYSESMVHDVNVTGNVSAIATDGFGADICGPESSHPMPYALVQISGGSSAFADVNGNFTIPNAGSSDVTVVSNIIGQYFDVNSNVGGNSSMSQVVTPPGPANILHNGLNASEFYRSEVNCYIHSNLIRDTVLAYNPAFPTIATQVNFPVNVNTSATQFCNAFYNGSSINFYISNIPTGGVCPNTGFGTVVHHEYGHHVVATGGSGQGAYGEGTGDIMGVLVTDNPLTGIGWNSNCGGGLRNANNNCQYQTTGCSSCGSEIHACGQLISGCVWSLRNQLLISNPGTHRQLLGNLVINSVLLHTGSSIAPDITIDYLTLDDNDGDISNGTPHRPEIAAAFGAHNMPAPPLAELLFSYPNGRPAFVNPNGGTLLRVSISPGASTLGPNPPVLNVNTGAGFSPTVMTLVAPATFEAAFPSAPCGRLVRYYVSAQTAGSVTVTSPAGAPASFFDALSATGAGAVQFDDNFQTDQGWTVATSATDGPWERAIPNTVCNRGNPLTDGDGSGFCYVTDNSSAGACNSDVDGGATVLTSPIMDASGGQSALTYWRWYSNTAGGSPNADTFLVEISSNGGAGWQILETVGPVNQAGGGWFFKQWSLGDIAGFPLTNQFRVRFTASDLGAGSVIEAGVDGVKLQELLCGTIPGDVDGDGDVDVDDLIAVVLGWGCVEPPTCPADVDGDGDVDVDDLIMVILSWT